MAVACLLAHWNSRTQESFHKHKVNSLSSSVFHVFIDSIFWIFSVAQRHLAKLILLFNRKIMFPRDLNYVRRSVIHRLLYNWHRYSKRDARRLNPVATWGMKPFCVKLPPFVSGDWHHAVLTSQKRINPSEKEKRTFICIHLNRWDQQWILSEMNTSGDAAFITTAVIKDGIYWMVLWKIKLTNHCRHVV